MHLSKNDQRILSILIDERDKLVSSPKAYRHADSVHKLNNSIVAIRNTAVYQGMVELTDEISSSGRTVLMTKGQTVTLRAW